MRVAGRVGEDRLETFPGGGLAVRLREFVDKVVEVLREGLGAGVAALRIARHGLFDRGHERVREAGLTNVETHVADAYHLPLDDDSVDRAFLVTVLPEIPDQARALAELRRVLRSPKPTEGKPGGLLSISEEFLDPDYLFAFETIRRVEAAGFKLDRRFGNFFLYTLNFREQA